MANETSEVKNAAANDKEILENLLSCVKTAMELRAQNPLVFEVSKLTSFTDYFVLLSASSDRRVKTIADGIRREMKAKGKLPLGVEGMDDGRWVLLDFGPFVIHIFFEEVRAIFDLEGLWSDARRVKIPEELLAEAKRKLDDDY